LLVCIPPDVNCGLSDIYHHLEVIVGAGWTVFCPASV
jgi:hypothetical protein